MRMRYDFERLLSCIDLFEIIRKRSNIPQEPCRNLVYDVDHNYKDACFCGSQHLKQGCDFPKSFLLGDQCCQTPFPFPAADRIFHPEVFLPVLLPGRRRSSFPFPAVIEQPALFVINDTVKFMLTNQRPEQLPLYCQTENSLVIHIRRIYIGFDDIDLLRLVRKASPGGTSAALEKRLPAGGDFLIYLPSSEIIDGHFLIRLTVIEKAAGILVKNKNIFTIYAPKTHQRGQTLHLPHNTGGSGFRQCRLIIEHITPSNLIHQVFFNAHDQIPYIIRKNLIGILHGGKFRILNILLVNLIDCQINKCRHHKQHQHNADA